MRPIGDTSQSQRPSETRLLPNNDPGGRMTAITLLDAGSMRRIELVSLPSLTHSEPKRKKARSGPVACVRRIVARRLFVVGSRRSTSSARWRTTQIEPAPAATDVGPTAGQVLTTLSL